MSGGNVVGRWPRLAAGLVAGVMLAAMAVSVPAVAWAEPGELAWGSGIAAPSSVPDVRFTAENGGDTTEAAIVDPGSGHATIPGTRWVGGPVDAEGNGPDTGYFRSYFDLPQVAPGQRLEVCVHSEDYVRVQLNLAVEIGAQRFEDLEANYQDPAECYTSDGPLYPASAGSNVLLFTVLNPNGGPTQLDFRARVYQSNAPRITSPPPPAATVGRPYSFRFTADGAPAPTWTATGLPAGLTLNRTTGVLSGVPSSEGTAAVAVTATNGIAPDATASYSLRVDPRPGPRLVVEPASYSFAPQVVGTGATGIVSVRNVGTASAVVSDVRVSPSSAQLQRSGGPNDCGRTLAAGASCALRFSHFPQAAGPVTTRVVVTSNAINSPTTFTVTGTGVAARPELRFSPTSLTFGARPVGSTTDRDVVVSNPGNARVDITSVRVDADPSLSLAGGGCPRRLEPGASCTLRIRFQPQVRKEVVARLLIESNAAQRVSALVVRGTGI